MIKPKKELGNISIIIPTLNEELFLPDLLLSLAKQNYHHDLEVIVVDGNSSDQTVKVANVFKDKLKNLKIIQANCRGVCRQRNIGVRHATHEKLLFLDADIVFPEDFFLKLNGKVDDGEIVLTAHYPIKRNYSDYLWLYTLFTFLVLVSKYKPICSGSFLLTNKNQYLAAGGFDEETVIGGDVIYGFTCIKNGAKYKFLFYPYVYSYPRRLRKEGRLGLMIKWFRGYKYMIKRGPIYANAQLHEYEFGNYSLEDKN